MLYHKKYNPRRPEITFDGHHNGTCCKAAKVFSLPNILSHNCTVACHISARYRICHFLDFSPIYSYLFLIQLSVSVEVSNIFRIAWPPISDESQRFSDWFSFLLRSIGYNRRLACRLLSRAEWVTVPGASECPKWQWTGVSTVWTSRKENKSMELLEIIFSK